ncbi:MAG TPA: dihydroorotate dehydrogenase [Candidatus Magasanikbacteria bacterium]|nr:MAG: dihydroorotate dehydrogenase B catalytic subunit [Candidatus Magasanikbacteria bacterium RIFCSPLOWO2_02_FULL_47_16]OGH79867.1 MAG: dihydroorotate dehydrogenase B catalytic subunit [Candidatus Magasanikbacteria bacterium RIFCSPHIGHO2_02_FULL_48_18]OGH82107.1 MAG: dihydroorotate dehydrogenase B catalytic subunit [Candidatus Magasanikbacteria bacterium RIFCSPLOWO2_12_FULL_47_9b]HAZ28875.1 dihydroorotate dehydrogenase [Candidatus Magasanikbacteria bacterium]
MLDVTLCGVQFQNPLVLASGILGLTGAGMYRVIESGAGAVTMKSVSEQERPGHPNPTMVGNQTYFLNAVGLSNPGIEEAKKEIEHFKQLSHAPLIGSIFAGTRDGFVRLAEHIDEMPIDLLEVNLSCPNVGQEFAEPFAYSKEAVKQITKDIKEKTKKPISIKLSPNVWNIAELAKAAEAAGADAITAVNTVSGMAIDVRARRPILHNTHGGVSGPALFPIALKCVYDMYEAVKIPIIGTGGVTTGEDALAMIMAGATLVGVGSAVYYRGEDCFQKITNEIKDTMNSEGIKNLDEIRGIAHETMNNKQITIR